MSVEIKRITITPEYAKRLLESNFEGQRNVRSHIVERYAADMESGAWNEDVGGLIVVSDTNKVIDGQHRLHALIKSGKNINFYVQTGVEESAYKVIDSGMSRTVTDVIDCKSKTAVAAIARIMAGLRKGLPLKTSMMGSAPISKTENIEYIERNTPILEKAASYTNNMKRVLKRVAAQGVGAAIYLMMLDDPDVVEYFFDDFMLFLPTDPRVASFKSQAQTAIINDRWDRYRQFSMTLRVLESIRDDEPKFGKFASTDSVIDRWNKRIKGGDISL